MHLRTLRSQRAAPWPVRVSRPLFAVAPMGARPNILGDVQLGGLRLFHLGLFGMRRESVPLCSTAVACAGERHARFIFTRGIAGTGLAPSPHGASQAGPGLPAGPR